MLWRFLKVDQANTIFAASLTLRGHEAGLFHVIANKISDAEGL